MSGFGWRATGGFLAIATLGWGGFNVVSLLAHEERTEVRTYDASDVRVLDVDNSDGPVTVVGSSGRDEITVTAEISDGLRKTGESQALVDGRLELRASCPNIGSDWCQVKYTVEVPTDIEVRADTDNGQLTVRGIDGPVTLDSDNGSIEVTDLGGNLTTNSNNGSVTASALTSDVVVAESDNGSLEIEFLEPPATVDARSNNGTVEVVVPRTDDFYNLDVSTDNGDVSREVRDDPSGERRITIETDNGDAIVRYGP
jgi:Putative adhesin